MKNLEVYISVFFVVFGAVIFKLASSMKYYGDYGPGPGLLPLWISGIMTVLAIANLFAALKKNNKNFGDLLPKGTALHNLLSCIGSYLLFILIVPYAGFVVSSLLMLTILFSRGYSWKRSFGLSTLVTGVLYVVFGLVLTIALPVNQFGW